MSGLGVYTCGTKEENNYPVMASYTDLKSWSIPKSLGGNEDDKLWKTALNDLKICNMPIDWLSYIPSCCVQRGYSRSCSHVAGSKISTKF